MSKKLSAAIFLCACLIIVTPSVKAQTTGKYSVGQRVLADPTGLGNMRPGVVTEVLPFERYRVQLDDEVGRQEPTVMLERNMKAGAPAPQAGTPAAKFAAGQAVVDNFTVGQRVMGDPTGLGNMRPGVVTEVLQFDRYRVQYDEDMGRQGPIVMLARNMKTGAPPQPVQTAAGANTSVGAHLPAQNAATVPTHTNTNTRTQAQTQVTTSAPTPHQAAQQPHDEHAGDSDSPQWHTPGKGAPPSGMYECNKIGSAGFSSVGDGLEIRGNTYRGIGAEGGFHPYTLGAINRITWTGGLNSLPDNWTIKHSYFAGPDYRGRPLIKIYYRSKSGFNDCIDCVKR